MAIIYDTKLGNYPPPFQLRLKTVECVLESSAVRPVAIKKKEKKKRDKYRVNRVVSTFVSLVCCDDLAPEY